MKFCPACNNILTKSTENDILVFKCKTCFYEENSKPTDTLMLNISLKEEESLYKNDIYLNLASKDRIAPLIKKKCINCDYDYVRDINIMSSGESIFICPKCEHRFI
jgi:DNA-directed RNA polymerase subunit M/transcription elongation factor TFIIS